MWIKEQGHIFKTRNTIFYAEFHGLTVMDFLQYNFGMNVLDFLAISEWLTNTSLKVPKPVHECCYLSWSSAQGREAVQSLGGPRHRDGKGLSLRSPGANDEMENCREMPYKSTDGIVLLRGAFIHGAPQI